METLNTVKRNRQNFLIESEEWDESLVAAFERVAVTYHLRIALVSDHWQPTYAELNATANRLSHAIVACGGRPGDRVAVLMQHDSPAIATLIAVLKAGRIIVVLNSTHPSVRLRELIGDSEASLMITESRLRNLADEIAGPFCSVLGFEEYSTKGPHHNLSLAIPPTQVAVLGYTSGSTNRPKGVMVTHRQVRRNVAIHAEAMECGPRDRLSLLGSLSAGQAMGMTWCALLSGAALCPFPVVVSGVTGLADWISSRGITVYSSSATVFRTFMKTLQPDVSFPGVRAVRVLSEPATSDDFKLFQAHFAHDCCFIHTLSCRETSNIAWSRWLRGDTVPQGRLPIGTVSKGQEVLILDENERPAAAGQIGEIAVRSRYVAAGYWRNPDLTAQRFSADLDGRGLRLFRTGDLGRINAAGLLEFCGRRDDRVKIRGNRIELSEIEAAIHRLPGVERAVVEAVASDEQEHALVGFVTFRGDERWSQPELRRALRAILPDYMIPSEFVSLQRFPLTPAGKIDREELRTGYRPNRQPHSSELPKTETELLLAAIWARVFELRDVGRDDDFFVLGGDSLTAAQIAAHVHDSVKVELKLALFADHPKLAALALVIDQLRAADAVSTPQLIPVPRIEPLPMSFWQERTWSLSRTHAGSACYTMARRYRIVGALNIELLRGCMDDLVRRHEILRTTFAVQDGRPVQIVHSLLPTELTYTDLAGATDAEAEAKLLFQKEAAWVFDLTCGPLLRFSLVRLRDNEFRLLRVSHHIICDGASWRRYFCELAALYEAKLTGAAPEDLETPALQYGDYAAWQRKALYLEGDAYKRSVSWWKHNLLGATRTLDFRFKRVDDDTEVVPTDGIIFWGIDRQVSYRLNALAPTQNATRSTVRLAAFVALLAAETGESDVLIGMYVDQRNRLLLKNMIGYFSNLVILRFRCDLKKSFEEWLSIVRRQLLEAQLHSEIPYDMLCHEFRRDNETVPEIKAIFHVFSHEWTIEFANIRLICSEQLHEKIPWGFTVVLDDQNEEYYRTDGQISQERCQVAFDPRLYDPSGVHIFVQRYKRLLDSVSRYPGNALSALLAMSHELH
jgi:amino acid adenylation domain-containing protein